LGNALKRQGQLPEAVACYRHAIRSNPNYANAHYNLGNALMDQGQTVEAVACLRQALRLDPNHEGACLNLGNALKEQRHFVEAMECFRTALRINPNQAEALNNLGVTLQEQGRLPEALECFRQAFKIKPDYAEAHFNLGIALKDTQPDEAIVCFQQALRLKPQYVDAYVNMGSAFKDLGLLKKALACYRKALQLKPDYAAADSNVLYLLQFSPDYDSASIYEEHRRWNSQHARPLEKFIQPHDNEPAPERRLRIGYISPDFRNHVLAFSFTPLFSNHDHENYEPFFYSDVLAPDDNTRRFQSYADVWRTIDGLTDEQVARLVRQDRIDIFVDLTTHMARNRLLVFARKPAPIQVCWGAYPGSTGLTAIDYRLTDYYLDPPTEKPLPYSEESIRLPDSFWCYNPLTNEPAVNALPALQNGYITFGCLNNFCKINDPTLKLWAKVMQAIPSSRLILLTPQGKHRDRILRVFQQEGITAERLTLVARLPRLQYLQVYHQIDVGLDSLPYNGHTTSLDSYWMGVPVVTLVGATIAGRAGLSQLSNLNMKELVAWMPEEFVGLAARLAADRDRLGNLRAHLRERLEQSPLMNGKCFARSFEAAYRSMWRRWCAR
jgi:predicted O-linked N-acetylglucosamine transferase (SPINDLY family)